jgi:hypothetical protein
VKDLLSAVAVRMDEVAPEDDQGAGPGADFDVAADRGLGRRLELVGEAEGQR